MLKRKKTKSYHGCIFMTNLKNMRKFVIEESTETGILEYLRVKDYPLTNKDTGTSYSFQRVDSYFKGGAWIKIGNMYKQE